ncbi:phosphatidylethanolamine-binding protein homolog F40A3.3-like [Cimex lectularius]|uniref:Phosphatidylethanolamine binding protein n=1 Tax=Cimex lectularius TaxID=79782 RepID=A0A8I6S7D3_CIMLE|nr:phosphatidylethanolamine-binding protein homolog F40A3.3-like [Cimex lectularius]
MTMVRPFVFSLFLALAFGEQCSVKTDFETTCQIGGLVLTKDEIIKVSDDNCDSVYKKQQFAYLPKVTFPNAEQDQTYTVICIDPDAPNHPKGHYYLHWIRANIPGNDLAEGNTSNGEDLIEYIGPAPPAHTGLHRYMFLAFKHSDPALRLKTKLTQQERRRFNLADWISNVQRTEGVICGPEAGVQFKAEFA